jgi:hypothetical protein
MCSNRGAQRSLQYRPGTPLARTEPSTQSVDASLAGLTPDEIQVALGAGLQRGGLLKGRANKVRSLLGGP